MNHKILTEGFVKSNKKTRMLVCQQPRSGMAAPMLSGPKPQHLGRTNKQMNGPTQHKQRGRAATRPSGREADLSKKIAFVRNKIQSQVFSYFCCISLCYFCFFHEVLRNQCKSYEITENTTKSYGIDEILRNLRDFYGVASISKDFVGFLQVSQDFVKNQKIQKHKKTKNMSFWPQVPYEPIWQGIESKNTKN